MDTQLFPRFIVSVRRTFGNGIGRIPRRQRTRVCLFLLGMLLTLAAGSTPPPPQPGKHPIPPRGFNRNGSADLAIGVPLEDVGYPDSGAVNVLYGRRPGGISATGNQYWNQNSPNIDDVSQESDWFGDALTFGDFDCDGYFDLAIGVPAEDLVSGVDVLTDAGAVHILYGSSSGLSSARSQFWTQDSPDVAGGVEAYDGFGSALAAGDFNADGCYDLAVGVPSEDAGALSDGAVNVLYGAPSGLLGGNQMLYQGHDSVIGTPVNGDHFGSALAAGDFDGDGWADLAIGIPNKNDGATANGAVIIVYGTSLGLRGTGSTTWSQNTTNVEGDPEDYDAFGVTLAVGDFDGDGYDDLAVGVPYEDVGALNSAGAVNILYGSAVVGITAAGDQIWHEEIGSIPSDAEAEEKFGYALAAGDFDKDGKDDLAIGVPWEDAHPALTDDGAVIVMYGTSAGLSDTGSYLWCQANSTVEGEEASDDRFGYAVAAGDFDGDGYDDLAVGVPHDNVDFNGSTIDNAGAVNILYGSATGISGSRDQIFTQNGLQDSPPEADDAFGHALVAAPALVPNSYLPLISRQ